MMSLSKIGSRLSRRSFLACTASAAATWDIGAQICGATGQSDPASIAARRKLAWRRRPLILDDDGDTVYADDTLRGPPAFLATRMHACHAADVDSIAWCMMWGIAVKGKNPVRYWQTQLQEIPFQKNMPDPTPVVTQYCRDNAMEVFGSLRMNDCHDAYGMPFPQLVYPLKVEHPEMLMGDESLRGPAQPGLAKAMWSGLDYAHEKVRADRLWWIENTAQQYDLNGVELNFFRMPWYFKLGEEERNTSLMTEFVRQARQRIDAISRKQGRTVLLGVRVPGTIAACNLIGLDIETWLKERLFDRMLTGEGELCYSTPAEELIQLGHRHEVPVYPCINCPATYPLGGDNLRGAASDLWWAGADGIYLWNFHYIHYPGTFGHGRPAPEEYQEHLPDIADPQRLKYLDKSFAVSVPSWEQYYRASAPTRLPLSLGVRAGAASRSVPVRIGDDVPAADRNGKLRDVKLRLRADGAAVGDALSVRFNDSAAEVTVNERDAWIDLPLPPSAVRQGVNKLQLGIARRGVSANKELVVKQARVDVRYQVPG